MRYIFVLSIIFLVMSCDRGPQEEKTTNGEVENNYQLSKQDIENIDFIEYGLSNMAQKASDGWKSYIELQTIINSIKDADLSYFQADKQIQKSLFSELNATIPNKIISQPVVARIRALETKFFKLRDVVAISTSSEEELLAAIKEFFVSFSNLNFQINKKLEKEAQDLSKPMN